MVKEVSGGKGDLYTYKLDSILVSLHGGHGKKSFLMLKVFEVSQDLHVFLLLLN